ncbi:MAG: SufD family Fe-S cluster assembly protein [Nitrososphaerota archaeon]|nr:SufD family Fe-S cluster assembly protein [Candidatus Calditenuaceae archaeon]MDW8072934.1 SufD family Fe-S cluster assembly protein [Nitrososphaerota archaeon]
MAEGLISNNALTLLERLRQRGLETFRKLEYVTNPLYLKHHERLTIDDDWVRAKGVPRDDRLPERFAPLTERRDEPVVIHLNGKPVAAHLPSELGERGVWIGSLWDALRQRPSLVERMVTEYCFSPEEEKLVGLIYSSLNSGVVVYVPDGFEADLKVRLIWLTNEGDGVTSALTLIYAGRDSRVSFLEEHYSYGSGEKSFVGHIITVIGGDNSSVKHALFNNLSNSAEVAIYRRSYTMNYASQTWIGANLGGAVSKSLVDNVLAGNGARSDTLEVTMATGSQRFDVTANLIHRGEGTTGRVVVKGLGLDSSRMIFKGIIKIEQRAKNTSAYLAEHAMLLSPNARADAIPGLEIESDNVKATHSASVSQVDPEQLWYLMTRGLSKDEAVRLIATGFFEPVISQIDVAEVRWSIRHMLENKWQKPGQKPIDLETLMDIYVEPEDVGKRVEDIFGTHYKYVYGKG